MGKFLLVLLLATVFNCTAGEIQLVNNRTTVFTNSITSDLSQTTSFTNVQPSYASTYHTMQFFYTVTGTNGNGSLAIDRTCDNVNWINVTNTTISTTSTNYEFQFTGKWMAYRYRETDLATNGSLIYTYNAQ